MEHFIRKNNFSERRRTFSAANERRIRLNKDFVKDERFFEHFVKINDRLTILMNELYDKMLAIKDSLNNSMNEKQIPANDFELEGTIDYEDLKTEDIEMPELLCNMDFSGVLRFFGLLTILKKSLKFKTILKDMLSTGWKLNKLRE